MKTVELAAITWINHIVPNIGTEKIVGLICGVIAGGLVMWWMQKDRHGPLG